MLSESYIHLKLAAAERQRRRPDAVHIFELAQMRRRNSLARRLARRAGRATLALAESLLAYGADRPRGRLTIPEPPVVERLPATYSLN